MSVFISVLSIWLLATMETEEMVMQDNGAAGKPARSADSLTLCVGNGGRKPSFACKPYHISSCSISCCSVCVSFAWTDTAPGGSCNF